MAGSIGGVVYLRHTGTDGSSYVQSHQTWDKERFIASQEKAVAEVNKKEKTKRAKVEVISQEDYRRIKWGRRK